MKSNSGMVYLDFEFNRTSEEHVNLVCCCTWSSNSEKPILWWLHNDPEAQERLKRYLNKEKRFIAYNAIAEGRALISLGLNPLDFDWIDLFLEYRCLTNHNDDLQWGNQLVNGVVKKVKKPRPKWEQVEEEKGAGFRATHSLAEATYKLLGQIRSTEHKDKMRDLIISDPERFELEDQMAILQYCAEDVEFLPRIYEKVLYNYRKYIPGISAIVLDNQMKKRGRYSAHTSIMESRGYPIDYEKTKNFSRQVGNILYDCQREINQLFPDLKPFRWDRKTNRFTWNQITTRGWVAMHHDKDKWMKTEKGELSLSLEAFEKFYPYKHDYPKDSFGAQIVRYLKLKQNLYGFVPSADKKKKTFWDSVGSDKRVRPYMNIFGAQSGRSQPASTGFMFLKPAWMRALVIPGEGYAMAGIDYGSQEFLISALLSEDEEMINAYLSGDVYLAFAKSSGMVPQNATKESHKFERNLAKSTVLGISYKMSKYGLSTKLSLDTGKTFTEDEAQELIDAFYQTYPDFKRYQDKILNDYHEEGMITLPCGWRMFGDNENKRSVNNIPIQGFGSSVMREAVDRVQTRGIYVPFTLHDALYIEYKIGEEWKIYELAEAMREAFAHYFSTPEQQQIARKIKLDPFAWSRNYPRDGEIVIGPEGKTLSVPCNDLYIDDRAIADYKMFSKYFNRSEEEDFL